jgi:hypothetical protein
MLSVFEAARGLERLGVGHLLSLPSAVGINLSVALLGVVEGRPLHPRRLALPDAGFVRHPDSRFVHPDGVFDERQLRKMFARFGETFGGDALTLTELVAMITYRLSHADQSGVPRALAIPAGLVAGGIEWGALLWMAGTRRDGQIVLTLADVRRFFTDVRFFEDVAARVAQQRSRRARTLPGRLRNLVQSWLL